MSPWFAHFFFVFLLSYTHYQLICDWLVFDTIRFESILDMWQTYQCKAAVLQDYTAGKFTKKL